MKKEITETRTVWLCDGCQTSRPVDWPCFVCGGEFCNNCAAYFPAGTYDGQSVRICGGCQTPYMALLVIRVNEIREELQAAIDTLRANKQQTIDALWREYRDKPKG